MSLTLTLTLTATLNLTLTLTLESHPAIPLSSQRDPLTDSHWSPPPLFPLCACMQRVQVR